MAAFKILFAVLVFVSVLNALPQKGCPEVKCLISPCAALLCGPGLICTPKKCKPCEAQCKPAPPNSNTCNTFCIETYVPVCGTDGVTYSNRCKLDIATCESNGKIKLAHEGACGVVGIDQ